LSQLCDALDRLVVDNGGRVYLAKDSRVSAGMLEQMYPRLAEFAVIRAELDPDGVFGSDLSRRLKI
ncbi:MAG: putative linked oxidoreductase, partial [Actinomycetia bacterium]|nr:putative linked oxidoreductase [Actinomycetes bacterium]